MWKPWVVHASVWAYKAGLVGILLAAILLAGSDWVKRNSFYRQALVSGLVMTTAVVAVGGWFNDVPLLTLGAFVVVGSAYVLIHIWRIFLTLVLAFVWWIGVPVFPQLLEDMHNVRLPSLQVQFAPGLECRGYPKYYDSSVGKRLVAARTDRSWIWDEVTEGLSVAPGIADYGCQLGSDGQVTFWYRDGQDYHEVTRRVK